MGNKPRRFTISVTPHMEKELDMAKKASYENATRNDMLRDLIMRGLEAIKADEKKAREEGKSA